MSAAMPKPRYRLGNIPAELQALDRWVVFALEPGKNGRPNKIPYTPGTSQRAKSNDPATWRPLRDALDAMDFADLYLGFAFTPELGMTFLDFDGVLGGNGAVKGYAAELIDALDSYTEASVSGAGVHVIVRGRPLEGFSTRHIAGKVEVYPTAGGRFCLLTGDTRPGLGSLEGRLEERTETLARLFPAAPPALASARPNGTSEDAELAEAELAAIVAALAPSRVPGQMHDVDLAIAGILAKNGVPEQQALAIVGRLSGDEPKALAAVRDSYRRGAAGITLKGYQGLRDLLPAEALPIIDGILSRHWQAQQPRIVTPGRTRKLVAGKGAMAAVEIDRFPPPPPEVYHGWFGGYLELVSETTEAPDQFHLASAMTIIGAWAGRTVHTRLASGKVYPNNYTVLVGNSSESKKDTAIKRAWEMALDPPWARERAAPPYVERSGVASAESFIKGLSIQSNVIIRMSEFSELLANARRKGTATILTMLMKAWDNPPQLSNDSLTNAALALNPSVSILAGTQPDVLAGDLIDTDISSGFANRIMFIPGTGKGPNPWPAEVDERRLHEHWVRVRRNLQAYKGGDEYLPIHRTPAVEALWSHFYLTPRGETAAERTMSQRHQVMVLKIALIYAMTDCAKQIEQEHLERAIAFVDWMWGCVRQMMGSWATSTDNRLAKRITDVLTRTGPIKRRDLQRKTSDPRWSPNDFARMVRSMLENQTLAIDPETGLIGLCEE